MARVSTSRDDGPCWRPVISASRNDVMDNFIDAAIVVMPNRRVAQKTGPRYVIVNILKTPWPNCVEIGELLQ